MTQPAERRFVMEPRLDAEVEQLNDAIDLKADLTDPRFTDQRVPIDNSVTSAKIANGTIVDADISSSAAIANSKLAPIALDTISDVNINGGTLTNGQALTYNSATSEWRNATPASTLDALTDVTITSGTLSGGQVIKYDADTTQWVNGAAAGGVTAAATAPNLATSAAGDAWFDTNDGTLYVCYVDTDSTKQWVQVQANSALEASILSRLGALEASNVAAGTQSPNYIINGAFDIWQRGTSFTSTGYGPDRWYLPISNATVSQETSDLPAGFQYGVKYVTTGTGFAQFNQTLERSHVIPLRGKTVTFSAYVKISGSLSGNWATQALYSNSSDAYSSTTTLISGSSKNVATAATTSWTRITNTFVVPSDAVGLRIENLPDTQSASGVTVRMTGMQLELGTVATAFRRNAPSIQAELAACQRYFIALGQNPGNVYGYFASGGSSYSTTNSVFSLALPVQMRTAPSGSVTAAGDFSIDLPSLVSVTCTSFSFSPNATANVVPVNLGHASNANFGGFKSVALYANNTSMARIYLSAEL